MEGCLEFTYDKFIFKVKIGYFYNKEDFWAKIENGVALIGASDYLQKAKGDVAFLETVEPGGSVRRGQELGKIETIKATLDIISPVAGKVVEVNPEIEASPYLINEAPYDSGWIYKIELLDPEGDKKELLNDRDYFELMKKKILEQAKELYGEKNKKVVVLPCSGIGKVFGALARETTYELVERVKPDMAVTTCLAKLVIGDVETKQLAKDNPVITIDGCPKECARKSAESQGVSVARSFQTIDFYKAHKDMKPEGISEIDETGRKLAAVSADELANVIDELVVKEEQ